MSNMKYKVTIHEITDDDAGEGHSLIYEQVVEELDLRLVIDSVNTPPLQRAPRSDKGKKRIEHPILDVPVNE